VLCEREQLGELLGGAKDVVRLLDLGHVVVLRLVDLHRAPLLVDDEAVVVVVVVVAPDLGVARRPRGLVGGAVGVGVVGVVVVIKELLLDLPARRLVVGHALAVALLAAALARLACALGEPLEAARLVAPLKLAARVLLEEVVVVLVEVNALTLALAPHRRARVLRLVLLCRRLVPRVAVCGVAADAGVAVGGVAAAGRVAAGVLVGSVVVHGTRLGRHLLARVLAPIDLPSHPDLLSRQSCEIGHALKMGDDDTFENGRVGKKAVDRNNVDRWREAHQRSAQRRHVEPVRRARPGAVRLRHRSARVHPLRLGRARHARVDPGHRAARRQADRGVCRPRLGEDGWRDELIRQAVPGRDEADDTGAF
jgi:hypothetical protein